MISFYLLLSVVPLYAADRGIGTAGAGLSTGVLMFAAVAAELATPALAASLGYRRLLIGGLVLLGAPALVLPATASLLVLMLLSVVRGIGFAIVVVTVGAIAATPSLRSGAGRPRRPRCSCDAAGGGRAATRRVAGGRRGLCGRLHHRWRRGVAGGAACPLPARRSKPGPVAQRAVDVPAPSGAAPPTRNVCHGGRGWRRRGGVLAQRRDRSGCCAGTIRAEHRGDRSPLARWPAH